MTLKKLENKGEVLFEKLNVKTLEEARKVPWQKILEVSQAMVDPPSLGRARPTPAWDAAIDGWMLPQSPVEAFKSGAINAVPLITCANLGELTGPGPLVMPHIIPAYVDMMEAVAKKNVKGYACIFDQVPGQWRKEGGVSAHSTELCYVFGDWDNTTGWWRGIEMFMQTSGAKTKQVVLDATDKFVSEAIMQLWAQFARTGKPAVKGLTDWPHYDKAADKYLYINEKPEIKSGFSKVAQK
jgi:carboxylesterase type B